MGLSLQQTKLNRPPRVGDYVARQRLLEQLERQRHRPLILVSAPAGFGKSTLLSAWLQESDWPGAWLSLDEHDSDLVTFLSYIIAALQTLFPEVGQETMALLNAASPPPLPVLASSLSNELERVEQSFILVLDDYHVIREPAIHTLLKELLRHPARCLHLALATRHDPPLPLADLRARTKIAEIRSSELRFSVGECQAFLQRMLDVEIDEHTAAALENSTEGWVAGLRLMALSLPNLRRAGAAASNDNGNGNGNELIAAQQANVNNLFVMDYLVSEVLTRQPADIQAFVLKTSILDQMSGPLCQALLELSDQAHASASANGRSDQDQLERIDKANLFVIPLAADEHGQWYRYHHLFREFLRRHLERSCSRDEIAGLHRRAGAWLARHGQVEDALPHLIAAGDIANAVRLVDEHRHALMNDEQWHRLGRWIAMFPPEVVEAHPELLMTEAWIARSGARFGEMPAKMDRAEALIAQTSAQAARQGNSKRAKAALCLQGELDCLRSYQYGGVDHERTRFYGQRALDTTPVEWWSVRLLARLHLAGAFHYIGDDKRAYAVMYEGMTEQARRDPAHQARLMISAAFVHAICADLDGTLRTAGQGLALCAKLNQPETANWARYHLGFAHYLRNELPAAEEHLTAVVSQRYLANTQCAVQSALTLALTLQAQGRWGEARDMAGLATGYALEVNHPFQLSVARAFQAELAARQGRLADAQHWLAHYEIPAIGAVFSYTAFTTATKVLLAANTAESCMEAAEKLSKLLVQAEATNDPRLKIEALALKALLFDAQGDREAALAALAQAVTLAQPGRVIRVFADLGPAMGRLLNQVHARGVATGFVEEILAAIVQTKPSATVNQNGLIEPLTERELEVLGLLAQRLSDKEIGQRLIISTGTVKRHTHSIYEKLYVGSRREAAAKAESLGLLTPHSHSH